MLEQSPLRLSYKAGPDHALEPNKPRRGDWITDVLLNVIPGTIVTGAGAGAGTGAHELSWTNCSTLWRAKNAVA